MKTIEREFDQKGWHLRQVKRQGNIAIYERKKEGGSHYEVIRIKSHQGFVIPGTDQVSEPSEYYPSDNSWGRDGFTCFNLISAENRFAEMIEIDGSKKLSHEKRQRATT